MRFLKDTLKAFVHDLRWLLVTWAITTISITNCAHVIRPPEAGPPAMARILETKIFVQSDERPEFEDVAFDVPEAGEAILRIVNAAKVGASPRQRIKGAEITLNGHVVVKPKAFDKHKYQSDSAPFR